MGAGVFAREEGEGGGDGEEVPTVGANIEGLVLIVGGERGPGHRRERRRLWYPRPMRGVGGGFLRVSLLGLSEAGLGVLGRVISGLFIGLRS